MSATEKLYALVKAEPSDESSPELKPLIPGQGRDEAVWRRIVESGKRNGVGMAGMRKAFKHWQQSNTPFDKNHPFHEDNAEFGTATGRYPYSYVPTSEGGLGKIKWGENVPLWKKLEHLDLAQTHQLPGARRIEFAKLYNQQTREHRATPEWKQELERIKNDPELLEDYLRHIAEHRQAYIDMETDRKKIAVLERKERKAFGKQGEPYLDKESPTGFAIQMNSGDRIPIKYTHTPVSQDDIEDERYRLMGYSTSERHNLRMERRGIQPGELAEQFIHGFEGTQPSAPTPRKLSPTPTPQSTSEVITEEGTGAAFDPQEATRRIREANQGGGAPAGGRPVINEPPQNSPSQIIKPDSESTIKDKPVTKKPPSDEEEGTQLPLDLLLKFVTA